jgi:hypothetical protein
LVFDILPQALNRIELGTLGRQEQAYHIGWDHERFGRMTASIIQQHDVQCILIVLSNLVQENLKVEGIELRYLQKKARTGRGFDRPRDREVLKTLLHCTSWFDTVQRHTPSLNRQQTKATLILAKEAYRSFS